MTTTLRERWMSAVVVVFAFGMVQWAAVQSARGQVQEYRARQNTDLIVDGNVENVFQAGEEYLVQIMVHRSEAPRLDVEPGARYPAPGEYIYAHVGSDQAFDARTGRRSETGMLPQRRSRVRAYLRMGQGNRWEAAGQDWYEGSTGLGGASGSHPPGGAAGTRSIGLTTERVSVGRRRALEVIRVDKESPAEEAGIERGDILLEADGMALESQDQLNAAYRKSRDTLAVTVQDFRTGRDVVVDVKTGSASGSFETSTPRPSQKQLGIVAELAFYGGEAVVKVTKVEPSSPAQRAGIVPGLLILKVNSKPVTSPEQLREAERRARGDIQMQVVDPRDKRERLVRVKR